MYDATVTFVVNIKQTFQVAGICNPETLPENFSSVLNEYTSNGFRVIGLAHKKLDRKMKWVDAQRVKRVNLECDMVFLGFLVMQNSLKPETTQVIRELHAANLRLIMVTGLCNIDFTIYQLRPRGNLKLRGTLK